MKKIDLMGKLTQKSSFTILLLFLLLIVAACDVVPGNNETPSGELFNTEAGDTQPLAVSSSWLASGPGTVQILGDGVTSDPSMSYKFNQSGFNTEIWKLSNTANEDGTITLPYKYTGFHSFFRVRVFAEAFVTGTSGTTTFPLIGDGPVNCCTAPSAGFTYSGEVTISVQEGDTFGFRFGGSHFDGTNELSGTFTVDLNKPYTIDECKNGGWEIFGFKNQGQCVRFIETGKDSRYFSLD